MESSAPEYIVALDPGSAEVRCLVAEVIAGDKLKVVGIGQQPTGGFQKGEVTDLSRGAMDIETAVKEAEEAAGVEANTLFVGAGSCQVRCFNSRGCIPVVSESHLVAESDRLKALKAAESVFLPTDRRALCAIPQRYCLDHLSYVANPVGMTASQIEAEVHLVTDTLAAVSNLQKCVEDAHLTVEHLLFQPVATAEAALTPDEKELGVILIDIGSASTDVVFYGTGYPRYSQVLPIGGHHVTHDIALGLNISLQEADRVKLTLAAASGFGLTQQQLAEVFEAGLMDGQSVEQFSVRQLNEIVEARVEETFSLAKRGLERAGIENYPRAGVVLAGGGAQLRGIAQKARETFCAPVRLARPQVLSEQDSVSGNPALAAAIGLLYAGLRVRRDREASPQGRRSILSRTAARVGTWIRNTF